MHAVGAVLTAVEHLELSEIPIPEIGPDDALLKVEACGLCGSDYEQWKGELNMSGGYPIIPGHEPFGRIFRIGENARKRWGVDVGDRVAVEPAIPCHACAACLYGSYHRCRNGRTYGLGIRSTEPPYLWGGYATHMYVDPKALVHRLPEHVPVGVMALHNPLSNAVRWTCEVGGVGVGSSVLICGPGQRGLLAVFAARTAGAKTIIVTGTSADRTRLSVARELGATATIDVDTEDVVSRVVELTGGDLVDTVVDVSSHSVAPIAQGIDAVKAGGKIVIAGVKGKNPLTDIYSDKILMKEIQLLGVLSAGWASLERAIALLSEHHAELAHLASHSYPLQDITKALRVLGREIVDGPDLLNVHVRGDV
jgi:threonine dehydrogenase-like Zn-dependent dehydrogenase